MTTKSIFLRHFIIGLTITFGAYSTMGCRSRQTPSASKTKAATTRPELAEYEVVDCPKTLCTSDTTIVGINPQESDLVALGVRGHEEQMALDESAMVDDVKGTDAERVLDETSIAHETLKKSLLGDKKPKTENVASTGLTALFGSLSGALATGAKVNSFARNNIEAETEEQRVKTLKKLASLITDTKKLMKPEDKEKLLSILPALKTIAGDDGWINRGDLPRFLPVIPNVVGDIADEKINQGYAEGIADLARSKSFAYRRWVRAPNGIIGRVVQKNINQQLSSAYAQKWAAIQNASAQFQQSFTSMMDQIGADRFYLDVEDGKNYYDPAAEVDEEQIDTIAKAVVGKSLRTIIRSAAENQGHIDSGELDLGPAGLLLQSVVLPDGVPIAEIADLIKESDGFAKEVFPKNLLFKLLPDGRIEVKRLPKKAG
jgi:hypothetical protein